MKKRIVLASVLLPLLLASCGGQNAISIESDAYVVRMTATETDFNILQLTDIHWNYTTNLATSSAYLTKVVAEAKDEAGHIDLIEITGDSILIANKNIAETLYALVNSWEIPWAFTNGNHDYQGTWSTDWYNNLVSQGEYALFPSIANDEVSGETNYVINVSWDGDEKWQVYNLDTKSLINENGLTYGYDYIRDDQVEWYKAQAEIGKANNGDYLPSISYFHIPFSDIFQAAESGTVLGGVVQEENAPYYYSGTYQSKFLDAAIARNGRGMFWGHDHSNDIVWDYRDTVMGYGVKSTPELYGTTDLTSGKTLTGGAIVKLHENGTFDLEHFFIDYQKMEEGVYDTWGQTAL